MEPGTNVNQPPASPPRARRIAHGVVRWAVVLVGLLIVILAYIDGLLPMILQVALAAGAAWGFGTRLVAVCRGKLNHHYPVPGQSHALDLVKLQGGCACQGDPQRLESYPAFGAVLRAPVDGRVVRAVDRYLDMAIGQTDTKSLVGNHVVIEAGPVCYVLLAHLQAGSVAVGEGQVVRAGDPVGRCGNSGNTSQPHLHLQVQSGPDFRALNLRTFPIVFRGARLIRGHATANGSPRRNDRITVAAGEGSSQSAEPGAGQGRGATARDRDKRM